jgi:hypothetical protein
MDQLKYKTPDKLAPYSTASFSNKFRFNDPGTGCSRLD